MYKPLTIYDKDSETHKLIVSLLTLIAKSLIKIDAEASEMLFEEILLA